MGLYVDDRWRTFKMLCVDPGKHFLGMSIHELNTRTGAYENIYVETIRTGSMFRACSTDEEFNSLTDRCLLKIRKGVQEAAEEHEIAFFAYESPFYNPMMPAAYGALCEVVAVCRQAVLDYSPYIHIDCMSPQNIKKGMGAGGTKGKEIMHEKVTGNRELMDALRYPVEGLTEHCIDSIAVGYNARKTILAPMEGWKL